MDMNELLAHLEVRNNITQEALNEKARYEQGVKAMREASNIEQA